MWIKKFIICVSNEGINNTSYFSKFLETFDPLPPNDFKISVREKDFRVSVLIRIFFILYFILFAQKLLLICPVNNTFQPPCTICQVLRNELTCQSYFVFTSKHSLLLSFKQGKPKWKRLSRHKDDFEHESSS